jgi:hypothetical protein
VPITELERFAPGWAEQVPDDPGSAPLSLGCSRRSTGSGAPTSPGCAQRGLDETAVTEAYQRLHGIPISAIYAARLPIRDRLRWALSRFAARFDRLSPFWIAYFLAITETLGEGIMSIPLALQVSARYRASAADRPGRHQPHHDGRDDRGDRTQRQRALRNGLLRALRDRAPRTLPVVGALDRPALFSVVTFCVYFLGFGSVLTGATGIPMGFWIPSCSRSTSSSRKETLDDTIASAVVIRLVNLGLAAITVIALINVDPPALAASTSRSSRTGRRSGHRRTRVWRRTHSVLRSHLRRECIEVILTLEPTAVAPAGEPRPS